MAETEAKDISKWTPLDYLQNFNRDTPAARQRWGSFSPLSRELDARGIHFPLEVFAGVSEFRDDFPQDEIEKKVKTWAEKMGLAARIDPDFTYSPDSGHTERYEPGTRRVGVFLSLLKKK